MQCGHGAAKRIIQGLVRQPQPEWAQRAGRDVRRHCQRHDQLQHQPASATFRDKLLGKPGRSARLLAEPSQWFGHHRRLGHVRRQPVRSFRRRRLTAVARGRNRDNQWPAGDGHHRRRAED